MAKSKSKPERRNRVVSLNDAVGAAVDPVFKKRGFASRDIIANWQAIAPAPYDRVAVPDKLVWPRGEAGAEGAVLFLRCALSHRMALAHEGATIAAAVNRYFGYVLVGTVKLSAAAFTPGSDARAQTATTPDARIVDAVEDQIDSVEDEGVKTALRRLGQSLMSRQRS